MDSWLVRMTAVKDRLLAFNDQVEWAPIGSVKAALASGFATSRTGPFPVSAWGTPLPVWRSETGEMLRVGSIAELQAEVEKANAAGFENLACPDDVTCTDRWWTPTPSSA